MRTKRESDAGEDEFDEDLLLTRKEAAAYKGLAGESSLRDSESRGLESVTGASGRTLYTKSALDRWSVKGTEPSDSKKKTILRAAAKARAHEAREYARQREAEEQREEAVLEQEWVAQTARFAADQDLRTRVEAKNGERKRAFLMEVMTEAQIRELLSIDGATFRKLVRTALIRPVEPPPEAQVEIQFDGPSFEREGSPMRIVGGPFYARADVLALLRDSPGT
jgi:hypothetical protein